MAADHRLDLSRRKQRCAQTAVSTTTAYRLAAKRRKHLLKTTHALVSRGGGGRSSSGPRGAQLDYRTQTSNPALASTAKSATITDISPVGAMKLKCTSCGGSRGGWSRSTRSCPVSRPANCVSHQSRVPADRNHPLRTHRICCYPFCVLLLRKE